MAAPKGNKFALFNDGGRPRVYDNPEEMIEQIEAYFNEYIKEGDEPLIPSLGHKPTVTGLALYLGFADRKSLYEYRDKYEEFSSIIKKALTYVEMTYEQLLESKAATGAIFALKNMGWRDKSELDLGGQKDNPVQITGVRIVKD
jgi:hypothetical protein